MLACCAWQMARHQRDPNKREGEECRSPRGRYPLCNPVSLSRLHRRTDPRDGARGREDRQQPGECDHYLGECVCGGGVTTGTGA